MQRKRQRLKARPDGKKMPFLTEINDEDIVRIHEIEPGVERIHHKNGFEYYRHELQPGRVFYGIRKCLSSYHLRLYHKKVADGEIEGHNRGYAGRLTKMLYGGPRQKKSHLRKELKLDTYLAPNAKGPVFEYIRENMKRFGAAAWYKGGDRGTDRRSDLQREIDSLRHDVTDILKELYGEAWPNFVKSLGAGPEVLEFFDELENDIKAGDSGVTYPTRRKKHDAKTLTEQCYVMRQMVLMMLVHVYNVVETTREIERELWVCLQRAHDVRLNPNMHRARLDTSPMAQPTAAHMRERMFVQDQMETLLMPLRVRALINNPDDPQDVAIAKEREKILPDYWSKEGRSWSMDEAVPRQHYEEELSADMSEISRRLCDRLIEDKRFTFEDAMEVWKSHMFLWSLRNGKGGSLKKTHPRAEAAAKLHVTKMRRAARTGLKTRKAEEQDV